jgi:hypothetical protein
VRSWDYMMCSLVHVLSSAGLLAMRIACLAGTRMCTCCVLGRPVQQALRWRMGMLHCPALQSVLYRVCGVGVLVCAVHACARSVCAVCAHMHLCSSFCDGALLSAVHTCFAVLLRCGTLLLVTSRA